MFNSNIIPFHAPLIDEKHANTNVNDLQSNPRRKFRSR